MWGQDRSENCWFVKNQFKMCLRSDALIHSDLGTILKKVSTEIFGFY